MSNYNLIIAGMLFSLLIALTLVLFYLRYKRHLTQQLLEMSREETEHQRALLYTAIQSQEKERKRIGMNLHDDVGTALSSLRMMIENYGTQKEQTLPQCKSVIDRVIRDVRNISHDLSPIKKGAYDFTDALEDRCDAINQSGELRVNLFIEYETNPFEEDADALALYRVISELLNNTIKHARAKAIEIRFSWVANKLLINYSDDGIGMPASPLLKKGMGLQNIESRLSMIGATYSIDQPNSPGFRIHIEYFPLAKKQLL